LPYGGEARRAFRADEAALEPGYRALIGEQRLIGYGHGGPVGGVQRVEDEDIA
jgi:hypothetical protein